MKALNKYDETFGFNRASPDIIQQKVEKIKTPQVVPIVNNPQVPDLNQDQPNQAIAPDNQELDGNNPPAPTEKEEYNTDE